MCLKSLWHWGNSLFVSQRRSWEFPGFMFLIENASIAIVAVLPNFWFPLTMQWGLFENSDSIYLCWIQQYTSDLKHLNQCFVLWLFWVTQISGDIKGVHQFKKVARLRKFSVRWGCFSQYYRSYFGWWKWLLNTKFYEFLLKRIGSP